MTLLLLESALWNSGEAPLGPAQIQSPLFFETPQPEGGRGGIRNGIKFWLERVMINLAGELSLRAALNFQGDSKWFRVLLGASHAG